MSKQLRELQGRKSALVKEARALTDLAASESRDLGDDEVLAFEALTSQMNATSAAIDRETTLISEEVTMQPSKADAFVSVTDNREADPRRGFTHIGEYLQSVCRADSAGRAIDDRLLIGGRNAAAPGTFGSDNSGADGGFLVPPTFSQEIYLHSLGEDALLPLTDNVVTDSNAMAFPRDETTPWGTNGIRAYWQAEASVATLTKPLLGLNTLRMKKLMALVPVTDELLADANALASYIPSKVGNSIRWKTNEAILFGSGNGTPQGAMNSGATITVAKTSGQATLTLTALNLANMIARLPPGSFASSVWIINNDVLPALFTLTLGNYPVYMPVGGNQGSLTVNPYGMLFGRPVIVSQHAASFTSQGDVLLCDLKYYQTITKPSGLVNDVSMHLYFDADAAAFRTTFRVDGMSKIAAAISPAKGSNTLSPFIQLAAR